LQYLLNSGMGKKTRISPSWSSIEIGWSYFNKHIY